MYLSPCCRSLITASLLGRPVAAGPLVLVTLAKGSEPRLWSNILALILGDSGQIAEFPVAGGLTEGLNTSLLRPRGEPGALFVISFSSSDVGLNRSVGLNLLGERLKRFVTDAEGHGLLLN